MRSVKLVQPAGQSWAKVLSPGAPTSPPLQCCQKGWTHSRTRVPRVTLPLSLHCSPDLGTTQSSADSTHLAVHWYLVMDSPSGQRHPLLYLCHSEYKTESAWSCDLTPLEVAAKLPLTGGRVPNLQLHGGPQATASASPPLRGGSAAAGAPLALLMRLHIVGVLPQDDHPLERPRQGQVLLRPQLGALARRQQHWRRVRLEACARSQGRGKVAWARARPGAGAALGRAWRQRAQACRQALPAQGQRLGWLHA